MAWPTTDDPKTEFVTIRLTFAEAALLDASASVAGMSRSAYVRDCVQRVAAADQRKAARLKATGTETKTGTESAEDSGDG